MSLLPPTATFAELVAECFVAHRGQGLMLSALDAELISAWAESGAPFEVVARGIRRAAEKVLFDALPGQPALRSLRACRREVEGEIRKHLRLNAGRSQAIPSAAPASSFQKALQQIARSHPTLRRACERLSARSDWAPEGDPSRREATVVAAFLRSLPFPERRSLLQQARALMGPPVGSLPAQRLALRFHRASVLRRALDLPPIW